MPTTLSCRNRAWFATETSQIAVASLTAAQRAYSATVSARRRSPAAPLDLVTVLAFSAAGLAVSICLNLLLPLSPETASFLAQFG